MPRLSQEANVFKWPRPRPSVEQRQIQPKRQAPVHQRPRSRKRQRVQEVEEITGSQECQTCIESATSPYARRVQVEDVSGPGSNFNGRSRHGFMETKCYSLHRDCNCIINGRWDTHQLRGRRWATKEMPSHSEWHSEICCQEKDHPGLQEEEGMTVTIPTEWVRTLDMEEVLEAIYS